MLFCISSHPIAYLTSVFIEFSGTSHRVGLCLDKKSPDYVLLWLKTWFPHRPGTRMGPASLCPGFQQSRAAFSQVARSLPDGHATRLPALCAAYQLQPPGHQQGAEVAWRARVLPEQRQGGRCFWWCHGKAVLVCICYSVTLLLFPAIKYRLAENSLSLLQYCSVVTQTLLKWCLNTNI